MLATAHRAEYQQVMTLGKYKIDGWLYRENDIVAWVECKWLEKEGFYGLNVPKYIEGCELAAYTNVPFLYGVRVPGKIGFITVHNGAWPDAPHKIKRTGGVRQPPNWDDIEPMVMFNGQHITWVATK